MYRDHSIAVVIPAYNEAKMLPKVIETLPDLVDRAFVVNDGSLDNTVEVVKELEQQDQRVKLVNLEKNQGVGAARTAGFRQAIQEGLDLFVAMDGDAQMNPDEISDLLDPLVDQEADFTKANRLSGGKAWEIMPRFRFFLNAFLTLFTKIASGYWHVTDSQTGFFAMTRRTAERVDFDHIFPRYGCENSLLIHLSVVNARVLDIPSEPRYKVGEKSTINIWKDWFPVVRLLISGFFWRIAQKYVIRDFHPLVFFYLTGIFLSLTSIAYFGVILFGRIIAPRIFDSVETVKLFTETLASPLAAVTDIMLIVLGLQMLFFAMWLDMEENNRRRR